MINLNDIPRDIEIADFKEIFYESLFLTKTGRAKKNTPISLLKSKSKGYKGMKKDFFDYFKENKYSKLKEVIIGDVIELTKIIDDVNEIFENENPFCEEYRGKLQSTIFGNIISEIFDYDDFRKSYQSKELLRYLNVKSCTYCNCVPTALYKIENGNERALVTYDHFYSQVEHPFLSLSLFNLIPSCPYCNPIKGSKSFTTDTHVHAYLESLDENVVFTINGAIPGEKEYEISIAPYDIDSKFHRTLNAFEVLQNYNTHKDIVDRIYTLRRANPQGEMDQILAKYSERLGKVITYDEFWELEIDYDRLSFNTLNKPFNKLKRDIASGFFI